MCVCAATPHCVVKVVPGEVGDLGLRLFLVILVPTYHGHHCNVYTEHKALKSLLITPHSSGKLACWGLVIQELKLHIHRPGCKQQNKDALSHDPLPFFNGTASYC